MLKSVTSLTLDADALIRHYHSWSRGALVQWTDTSNGPKTAVELRGLRSNTEAIARSARELLGNAAAGTLSQDVRDDLVAIAEELEVTTLEIDAIADPENVWSNLDRQKKSDVTQRVFMPDDAVQAIRARAEGRRRRVK